MTWFSARQAEAEHLGFRDWQASSYSTPLFGSIPLFTKLDDTKKPIAAIFSNVTSLVVVKA